MEYDFSFVSNSEMRRCLEIMQAVISDHNLWEFVRDFTDESFIFSNNPSLDIISKDERNDFHSGASFALTLRNMQFILHYGINEFKQLLKNEENLIRTNRVKDLTNIIDLEKVHSIKNDYNDTDNEYNNNLCSEDILNELD